MFSENRVVGGTACAAGVDDDDDDADDADDDDGLNRNHYWISRTLTMMMTELYWCRFLYFFQCQRRRKT